MSLILKRCFHMLSSPIKLRRKYVISGYGLPLPFSCYDKIKSYTHLLTRSEFTNIDNWLLTGVQRGRLDNINNINNITKPAIVYINNYQLKQDNIMLFVNPIELHCTHLEIGDNFLGPLINKEEIKERTFGEVTRTLKIRDDKDDILYRLLSKTDIDMNVEIKKAKMEKKRIITSPYQNWLSQRQLPSDTLKKYIGFYVVGM